MPDQPSDNVSTLFSAYVRLRQSGQPVAQAAHQLKMNVDALSKHELNELALLTQKWESLHTNSGTTKTTGPLRGSMIRANNTRESNSPQSKQAIRPIQNKPTLSDDTDIMIHTDQVIRPIQVKRPAINYELVPCPRCSKLNRVGEAHCYNCGEVLAIKRISTQRLEDTLGTRRKLGASYFGSRSSLILAVRNTGDTVELLPNEQEIVIGRSTDNNAINPDIDLSPFGADKLGVSRLHASLRRNERSITITDMNSSNKTYINGQLLYPQEVRVLNDGDEVRLGRMYITVRFRHP